MTRPESRIPGVGQRGRTFGGEFEVVAHDQENVVIRWVDDGATAEFDASVFQLVLDSYARALDGDDALDALGEPEVFGDADVLGSLEEEAAEIPCPLCSTALDASRSCEGCGTLECPACNACDCVLAPAVDSAGRTSGRM